MADIVILDMEEPPHCMACRMLDGDPDDGFCHAANKWFDDEWFRWYQYPDGDIATDKPLNCPLVTLPEGHGRLVDASEVLEKADKSPWFDGDVSELGLLLGSEVTTIVPADGGRPMTAPTSGTGDPSPTEGEGTDSSTSLRMTETEGG